MILTKTLSTNSLNDIEAAFTDALEEHGFGLSRENSRRALDYFLCDDRFTHLLTSAIHEVVGSPFDRGELGTSCDDYALAITRLLLWRS